MPLLIPTLAPLCSFMPCEPNTALNDGVRLCVPRVQMVPVVPVAAGVAALEGPPTAGLEGQEGWEAWAAPAGVADMSPATSSSTQSFRTPITPAPSLATPGASERRNSSNSVGAGAA